MPSKFAVHAVDPPLVHCIEGSSLGQSLPCS